MNAPPDIAGEILASYRRGYFALAAEKALAVDPAAECFAEVWVWRMQSLMELGRFQDSIAAGREAVGNCPDPAGRAALQVVSAHAELLKRPDRKGCARLGHLIAELASAERPVWRAFAKKWEARWLALEVVFHLRSINALADVRAALADAAAMYDLAGRPDEAREQRAALADAMGKGPPPDPGRARVLWKNLRDEAAKAGDAVMVARAALALAEDRFETTMETGDDAGRAALPAIFEETAQLYSAAGFSGADAAVQAASGRKMLRYGLDGVALLRAAGESWEKNGLPVAADGVWRDLHTWHAQRGEASELENIEEKLHTGSGIDSGLTAFTNSFQVAHGAYVRGDFAASWNELQQMRQAGPVPSQEASLLMQEANTLLARHAREEARPLLERAEGLLRPVAPCLLLGDVLSRLGDLQTELQSARVLSGEATDAALACGRTIDAAMKIMNLGQFLSQPAAHGPAQEVDELYRRAGELLRHGHDLETVAARGNLAQRRGQTAFFRQDFPACLRWYEEAGACYQHTGRNADLAFLLAQQGLVAFQMARTQRRPELWEYAQGKFDEAGGLFARQELRFEEYRTTRLAAMALWEGGWLLEGTAREEWQAAAGQRMEAGADLLDHLRAGRRESDLLARQSSQEDFARETENFLDEGFRFFLNVRKRSDLGLLWLERAKARALLDAMATLEHGLVSPGDDSELAAREQAMRQTLARTTGTDLLARRKRARLVREIDGVLDEMMRQPGTAGYAALRRGRSVGWPEWRSALERESAQPEADGRPVVSVHFAWPRATDGDQRIRLIACRADWDSPRVATVETCPADLDGFARACFGPPGTGRSALRQYLAAPRGDRYWQQKFASLLAPLPGWTTEGDIVGLIPHGPLHGLPLHALLVDGVALAERNAVFFAPSAAVLLFCWERKRGFAAPADPAGAVVFGCSLATGGSSGLPRAVEEAGFVAGLPGLAARTFLDREASRRNFLENITEAEVVHFVGHGVEASTGWNSGLKLANDEQVTALDLYQARLKADLVTLSGCRTARNRWSEGDEALGLTPALLYAGASSILASQWEVKEPPTEGLMRRFYTAVYGGGNCAKAEALRQAVGDVRKEFPLMADWASFTLLGDWK